MATVSADSISLNSLCSHHGLPSNPLKSSMKKRLWVDEARLWNYKDKLDEDTVYYSAHDVLYLLDLFNLQMDQLQTDYVPLLHELCNTEILQAIDTKLGRERRKLRQQNELNTIFLDQLDDPLLNRLKIHELVTEVEGLKRVYLSPKTRTAHIELKDRLTALQAFNNLTQGGHTSKLVVEIRPEQDPSLVASPELANITPKTEECCNEANTPQTKDMCKVIDALIEVGRPISVEVHQRSDSSLLVEVCTPINKFGLETSNEGNVNALSKLMSSNRVVKVVLRSDVQQFIQLMAKLRNKQAVQWKSVFDIQQAARVYDYFVSGRSLMSSCGDRLNDIFRRFQCVLSHKKSVPGGEELRTPENMLRLYYCFHQTLLTNELQTLLRLRTENDLSSLQASSQGQSIACFRKNKRLLRELYEARVLHITRIADRDHSGDSSSEQFGGEVQSALHDLGFNQAEIVSSSPTLALVRLRNSVEVNDAMIALEETRGDEWLLNTIWDVTSSNGHHVMITTYNLTEEVHRSSVEKQLNLHARELTLHDVFRDVKHSDEDDADGMSEGEGEKKQSS